MVPVLVFFWKYLSILLQPNPAEQSRATHFVHQPPLFLLFGRFVAGAVSGLEWVAVVGGAPGGLRVDGAVPRVAVHNGPVGSCSSTVAGAIQSGHHTRGF